MPDINLNDAINFINERGDVQKLRSVQEFFTTRLKEKKGMLEQEVENTFYLLRCYLKKHSYFENMQCIKLRDSFLQKTKELEQRHIVEYKKSSGGPIEVGQLKAFYNMMEFYCGALQEDYQELRFQDAEEMLFEAKMRFRQHVYFVEKNYKSWFSYFTYEITSLYGKSMYRWFATSILTVVVFAFLFAFIDSIETQKIVDLAAAGHWYDYFYYSIVTFTTLGYGDILPITVLQKIVVSIEVVLGYFMFGMLMNLLGKKIS